MANNDREQGVSYERRLTTLEVHTMSGGEPIPIVDTETDNIATRALNEFKNYDTMHFYMPDNKETVIAIPYHEVLYIEAHTTVTRVQKEDPYGCGSTR